MRCPVLFFLTLSDIMNSRHLVLCISTGCHTSNCSPRTEEHDEECSFFLSVLTRGGTVIPKLPAVSSFTRLSVIKLESSLTSPIHPDISGITCPLENLCCDISNGPTMSLLFSPIIYARKLTSGSLNLVLYSQLISPAFLPAFLPAGGFSVLLWLYHVVSLPLKYFHCWWYTTVVYLF